MKKDMTSGKEWKLILLFTLPIMAGNLLQQLYNTVDGIVVGKFVGEDAFAGVGTCTPLTLLVLAFALGLGIGAGVIVSQYFGAQKHEELSSAVNTALLLMGAVGIFISILAFIFTPFLLKTIMDVPDDILHLSTLYFRIYCVGLFFQFIYNCIASILRGVGDSKATLYFLLISAGGNIVLDLLFVVAFNWDVAGVGIATVISQIICAIVSYIYLRKRFPRVSGAKSFDPAICKMILRMGVPAAIQQSIVSIGNVAMQRLVNGFGQATISAYSAGNRIDAFMFVPITGFQAGLANFTGQNIGAGRLDRVKRGLRVTIIMSVSTTVLISILLYVFAGPVISFFSITGEAHARGVEMVHYLSLLFWLFSYYMTVGGVLQGAGDVVLQSAATLSALTTRVVLGYLAVHFGILGYNAAWITNPIGWVVATTITTIRYFSGRWKTKAVVSKLSENDAEDNISTAEIND